MDGEVFDSTSYNCRDTRFCKLGNLTPKRKRRSHEIDWDHCFSCFVEKYPGQAKRWVFHLPALGPHGTIVLSLILAWSGTQVMHCTGMSPDGAGADNMLHGYFVAAR
jgi:hypothetical protein